MPRLDPTSDAVRATSLRRERFWARLTNRTRLLVVLYAIMVPTFAGMLIFNYYPKWGTIKYSFFLWDGSTIEEFRWFRNFTDAFLHDALFWKTFRLVGILLVANVVKMWPCIFTAIALHRLKNEKAQYVYRVLFVIPMVIPALVWLLIWKSFYNPTVGILNTILEWTGLMKCLAWLDFALPTLGRHITPAREAFVDSAFGSVWGLLLLGVIAFSVMGGLRGIVKAWIWWLVVLVVSYFVWRPKVVDPFIGVLLGPWMLSILVPLVTGPIRGLRKNWPWLLSFAVLSACIVYRLRTADVSYPDVLHMVPVRMIGLLAIAAAYGHLLSGSTAGRDVLKWFGIVCIIVAAFFVLTSMTWTDPTNGWTRPSVFARGKPAWLGHTKLVIPAILFWGFPWVGTVGVLIYLAGLQNISQDVYEAAELDGVGAIGKIFRIELPLILTQVRINLIFMTIGTLTGFGLFLLLLGPHGGPGNKGMPPGLYMYREAFFNSRFGYACALGMVLFVMVLVITILYQKYVKVEK